MPRLLFKGEGEAPDSRCGEDLGAGAFLLTNWPYHPNSIILFGSLLALVPWSQRFSVKRRKDFPLPPSSAPVTSSAGE